ncbi:heavy metal translocating P-type ATPase [Sphingomicrobium arenosum]|uniref:heavy metal translocating P-type ATPase n=1 Tax=Sphingomicrobium arenosum TaxID=2233861 RepID=UPI002240EDD0|nr:heavy metal translocating P-type ATPase [Sphingomicrobium arenosum]
MDAPRASLIPTASSLWSVEGMRCAACIARIERELPATKGITGARVNLSARRVRVEHEADLPEDAIADAFARTGFDAHPYAGETIESPRIAETRALVKALAVAGFAMMNIMLLSVSVWAGAEGITRSLFHWLSALIAVPAVAYAGRPFFSSALAALKRGRTNMDVPISIGVLLATGMSLYETATHAPHAYFDSAVMLLFFLLIGRVLDSIMRARAESAVATLMRRIPREALLLETGGATRIVAVEALAPGDRLLVAAGERIPADGRLQKGHSEVDRSLVTGESLPVTVDRGADLLAGTINLAAPIEMRVTAAGEATAIAEIARLMERASESRSAYVRIADRAARLYTPLVHSLALLAFIGWMLAGVGAHQALLIAVSVLIITCPCALGLAVPVAQVVAAGAFMRSGILVREGSAFERLAGVTRALFDKTGTLTRGDLRPLSLPLGPENRAVLAAMVAASTHPLSRAIRCRLEDVVPATLDSIDEHVGQGLEARIGGRLYRFGRPDWVGLRVADSETQALAAFAELPRGASTLIRFEDQLRPEARASLASLSRLGVASEMLSGDRAASVERVGGALGIPARGGVDPGAKEARIVALQFDGHGVLMVGDGLNDGPALKRADVSMAPASASDVGQTAADFLFLGEGLDAVPRAVRGARATMRVIRQNFALAIIYNVCAVPLALAGKVTPLVAAIAMSGSSLIVVANSLRLARAAR